MYITQAITNKYITQMNRIMKSNFEIFDKYGNELHINDVLTMLPAESELDEIAFKKYGNDPDGAIKFNLVKRVAFIEGCKFMLRLIKGN